jgi:hypothetical protein
VVGGAGAGPALTPLGFIDLAQAGISIRSNLHAGVKTCRNLKTLGTKEDGAEQNHNRQNKAKPANRSKERKEASPKKD